jgi:drug/metabolite transporter (DMT)-like permease
MEVDLYFSVVSACLQMVGAVMVGKCGLLGNMAIGSMAGIGMAIVEARKRCHASVGQRSAHLCMSSLLLLEPVQHGRTLA